MPARVVKSGITSGRALAIWPVTQQVASIGVSRSLVTASYSREAEQAADDFSIEIMHKLGRPTKPMGDLIPIGPVSRTPKISFTAEQAIQVKILSALDMFSPAHDHPQTVETVRHNSRMPVDAPA